MRSLENLPSRAAIEAEIERRERQKIDSYYPETGPHRRELYGPHLDFFKAGAQHRERLFIAGNQVGKTTVGAYEVTCHLTGVYPVWWKGWRCERAVKCWVVGESGKKTREVVQERLFGPPDALGTGMIPADRIVSKNMKPGVPDAIDTAWIRHVDGKNSHLTFKSYEQGREGFDGDVMDLIWLDEEAPKDIYDECMVRMFTTDGRMILTFTPLKGKTQLIRDFLDQKQNEDGGPSVGDSNIPQSTSGTPPEIPAGSENFSAGPENSGETV